MSSLKDLASLIMVPSLYKDGELHTVKPLGNSILHPDATGNHDGTDGSTPAEGNFTFSRGSNLAATRVDVNGLIEKGRENLLLQSNQFDTTWVLSGATITGSQSGYDGSNDAWLLTKNTTGRRGVQQSVTSTTGLHTISFYAKAGTLDFIQIIQYGSATIYQFFDLANGVLGTPSNPTLVIDANIESVGNGWYRCSYTTNATITDVRAFPQFADLDETASSGNIYIQDAQLEAGLVATDYIETGASTAQAGILEDMPRLDYSGGASCPALLLEPQRTNLLPQSEYVGSSVWTKDNAAVSDNSAISPEGVQNASLVYPVSSSSTKWGAGTYDFNSASNDTYTNSIYVKSNGWRWVYMIDPSGLKNAWFDLQNGVTGTAESPCTSSIEPLGNDWFRCSVSSNITHTYTYCGVYFSDADNSYVCTPNGTSGAYVYGSQSEAGSYPTSYIPTYGSSVTRSLDQCELFGMNAAGISTSNNWTYFIDVDNFESGQEAFYLRSTSAELMHLYHQSLGYRNSSNSSSYPASWSWSSYSGNNSQVKMCIRYDGSQLSVFINGSKKSDVIDSSSLNTSFNYPFDQDKFHFAGNSKWDTNQKAFYDTALTDSECIALTTL